MPIHDLRCKVCHRLELDVRVGDRPYPRCGCGGERDWVPAKLTTDIWGGPRFDAGLQRSFQDKAELKAYMKKEGIRQAPSADKHHGARNESHLHLGKSYSYTGQGSRSDNPLSKRSTQT